LWLRFTVGGFVLGLPGPVLAVQSTLELASSDLFKEPKMEFGFQVGVVEKHQIKVQRNWFTGKLVISVDSQPVVTENPLAGC
jgi:hypothetical protein